ncbi:MAG: response regulator transcription factor [Polyangiaceae bacterium]|nr:response regulator transcription factor [Polyangiaceae bacterium]
MTRVLVVEDEPAIAESIAYSLRRDGYAVQIAGTVAAALRELSAVDLVILDLMLPDGSGFEVLGVARRTEAAPPVIVLSSRDSEADRVAALETGADDYVTKPFSPREIVARVRAVLRRAAKGSAQASNGAPPSVPLSADESTRRATVHNRQLDLTRVEFDLLACLLGAPGRVFTRAQLIDRVWGDGFAITDRTIDSHVKGLRKKVTEAGGDPGLIETVRGVGYRVSDRPSGSDEGDA